MYSDKVMDHFQNPRNVGEIEDASGVGTVGNAKCGDIMRMYLDVDENGVIQRLEKEEARLEKELARVNGMLGNERFVSKAPQAKIDEEKGKLEKYTQMMEQVKERLAQLRK